MQNSATYSNWHKSFLWYAVATGGNTAAPTPSTTTIGNTGIMLLEVPMVVKVHALIVVTITATTAAPLLQLRLFIARMQQQLALLTATGTNLLRSGIQIQRSGTGVQPPAPSTTTVGNIIACKSNLSWR
jgi:hypothetical protein